MLVPLFQNVLSGVITSLLATTLREALLGRFQSKIVVPIVVYALPSYHRMDSIHISPILCSDETIFVINAATKIISLLSDRRKIMEMGGQPSLIEGSLNIHWPFEALRIADEIFKYCYSINITMMTTKYAALSSLSGLPGYTTEVFAEGITRSISQAFYISLLDQGVKLLLKAIDRNALVIYTL